jgi:hypothetical protein
MTIAELDSVKSIVDKPEENVKKGMIGTVVHIANKPNLAYMVEFCDNYGRPMAMPFLLPDEVVKIENLTKEEYSGLLQN